ncbi:MAG: hypothetical protein LWW94_05015 [Candidatus Desulfofervidaceae bacterium]|nr:hypothetical protein [Candidatus Desulfofervidaceae bacterium]
MRRFVEFLRLVKVMANYTREGGESRNWIILKSPWPKQSLGEASARDEEEGIRPHPV